MAVVTLDLFSALTDSRAGAEPVLGRLAADRGWTVPPRLLHTSWDRRSKAVQATARPPQTLLGCWTVGLALAYADLGLPRDSAEEDVAALAVAVPGWPLWPDVAEGVALLRREHRVGILSNVDDGLAVRTAGAALVEPDLVLTSQRLGAFKPDPAIYRAAVDAVAPDVLVHVAASGRDVRGALEAGVRTVRLVRPGHVLDPDGPAPAVEVEDARDLPRAVRQVLGT